MSIKIKWLSDDDDATRGARRVRDSLADVADELEGVDDEAKRTERTLADTFDDVERDASRAGRKIGTDLDDGFRKASKGADEFKQEANSVARESAASFDDSAESIGDAFQEVAANAFGGFGPAGVAAGIAAAAGLGVAMQAITEQQEAADELKRRLTGAYLAAAEEGRAYLDEAQIQGEATRLLFEDRDKLKREAASIGVDVITLARAYAGSEEDVNLAIEAGNTALSDRRQTLVDQVGVQGNRLAIADEESKQIGLINDALAEQLTWHQQNKEAASDVVKMKRDEEAQTQRVRDADQERWEAYASKRAEAVAQAATPIVQEVQIKVNSREWDNWKPNPKTGVIMAEVNSLNGRRLE
ncbi:hypothetical protein [Microbacterium sp. NPDC064584]|uniref:hypothetical protein n=1 Tax=Microbacterium sp. NPDC064584 TaxID=3155817 RepID=UPI00342B44BE